MSIILGFREAGSGRLIPIACGRPIIVNAKRMHFTRASPGFAQYGLLKAGEMSRRSAIQARLRFFARGSANAVTKSLY
jgi:hypothetical protein